MKDSAARGGFLDEAEYEWAGVGLNEDGTFDLAAPKHWRDMQAKTGMRAFQGLHVGLLDSVGPHLVSAAPQSWEVHCCTPNCATSQLQQLLLSSHTQMLASCYMSSASHSRMLRTHSWRMLPCAGCS